MRAISPRYYPASNGAGFYHPAVPKVAIIGSITFDPFQTSPRHAQQAKAKSFKKKLPQYCGSFFFFSGIHST